MEGTFKRLLEKSGPLKPAGNLQHGTAGKVSGISFSFSLSVNLSREELQATLGQHSDGSAAARHDQPPEGPHRLPGPNDSDAQEEMIPPLFFF